LQEVQGHISQADVDPGACTPWLRVQDGLLCPTPGGGASVKRVFSPFDWHLRHYRSAATAAAQDGFAAAPQSLVGRSKSHMYGSTSGAAAGSGGDEVSQLSGPRSRGFPRTNYGEGFSKELSNSAPTMFPAVEELASSHRHLSAHLRLLIKPCNCVDLM
jgi:hypothetical protein